MLFRSALKWVYLSFSPLTLASLLFSAIFKASSDNHFAVLHRSSCFRTAPQHTTRQATASDQGSGLRRAGEQLSAIHPLLVFPPAHSLLLLQADHMGLWPQKRWGQRAQGRTSEKPGEGSLGEGGRRAASGELPVTLHPACWPWRRADLGQVLRAGAGICMAFSASVLRGAAVRMP